MRPIIDQLRHVFGVILIHNQNLWIDECLVLRNDRLSFKQYVPSKRGRFGIKLFVLCDGHIYWNYLRFYLCRYFYSYQEKSRVRKFQLNSNGIVTYLGQSINLFVDSSYSSVSLFETLFERLREACGTVRKNRVDLYDLEEKIAKGQIIYKYMNNLLKLK